MRLRIVSIVLLLILVLNVSSCKSNIDDLEERFSNYESDNNVVAVLDDNIFYFADHTLKLTDIISGDEEANGGYLFLNDRLYFSTSKQGKMFDFSFFVYECDLYGNDKKLIFEKHGYQTKPWALGKQGIIYLEYYGSSSLDASSRKIDSYNIVDSIYLSVTSGENSSLSDYKNGVNENYLLKVENDILTIMDVKKSESYIIDKEKLSRSEFGKVLTDLEYSYYKCTVTDFGQIYLTYRIKSNGSPYPHFICEYVPSTDKIVFKSLFFAADTESISVENVK